MQTTVTIHFNPGQVARNHVFREKDLCSHEKHIDLNNEHEDSFCDVLHGSQDNLRDRYEEIFGDAIAEYNSKQKRADRRLTVESYMKTVEEDNRGKRQTKTVNGKKVIKEDSRQGKQLEYEMTLTVGNTVCARNDIGRRMYDETGHEIRCEQLPREVSREILKRYSERFESLNPGMKMSFSVVHGDEGYYNKYSKWEYGSVHLHIGYIPTATNFKQGLTIQNSLNKCLSAMGCNDENGNGYDLWRKKQEEYLRDITREVYEDYCKQKGIKYDLDFYTPVSDRTREGDKTKEMFVYEQELQDIQEREHDVAIKYKKVKEREKAVSEREKQQQETADKQKAAAAALAAREAAARRLVTEGQKEKERLISEGKQEKERLVNEGKKINMAFKNAHVVESDRINQLIQKVSSIKKEKQFSQQLDIPDDLKSIRGNKIDHERMEDEFDEYMKNVFNNGFKGLGL